MDYNETDVNSTEVESTVSGASSVSSRGADESLIPYK
jgi:hypothetical protein